MKPMATPKNIKRKPSAVWGLIAIVGLYLAASAV